MGALAYIKAIFQAISSGGNFGFIAKNIATIFYIIDRSQYSKGFTEAQKLYSAALIDVIKYLFDGVISVNDVEKAVTNSMCGIVGINFYTKPIGLYDMGKYQNQHLVHMIMQMEMLILSVSCNYNYRDIVDMVISKKEKIIHTVDAVLARPEKNKSYSEIETITLNQLKDEHFRNIVLSFNNISDDFEKDSCEDDKPNSQNFLLDEEADIDEEMTDDVYDEDDEEVTFELIESTCKLMLSDEIIIENLSGEICQTKTDYVLDFIFSSFSKLQISLDQFYYLKEKYVDNK